MGDFRFYMQAVWNIYGWEWDSFVLPMPLPLQPNDGVTVLSIEAGNALDISKKDWIYGKPVDVQALLDVMARMLGAYRDLILFFGWTDECVQDANRAKLAKRYPDGVYSNADAIARADKVEYKQAETWTESAQAEREQFERGN
jgi:hypothetical protein